MKRLSAREALGGPWSTHWLLWAAFFIPLTLILLARQGAGDPVFPTAFVVSIALVQHLAASVVAVGGGVLLRRRWPILPLGIVFALWAASSLVRTVITGGFAASFGGLDPQFALRFVTSLVVMATWLPLGTYAFAQIDHRRLLLGRIQVLQDQIDEATRQAVATADEVRAKLISTIRTSVAPVLGDLAASIAMARGTLSRDVCSELGSRITRVHDETARLVKHGGLDAQPVPRSERRAGMVAAIDIPPRRPVMTAIVTTISAGALTVPVAARFFSPETLADLVTALAAACIAIGIGPALTRAVSASAPSILVALVGPALGVATAMAVLALHPWGGAPQEKIVLGIVTACGIVMSAALVTSSLSIRAAALEDSLSEEQLAHRLAALRARTDGVLDGQRIRISQLMHGPVQGRLAACAMALNFLATGDRDPQLDPDVIEQIIEHLDAVTRDLASLSAPTGQAS